MTTHPTAQPKAHRPNRRLALPAVLIGAFDELLRHDPGAGGRWGRQLAEPCGEPGRPARLQHEVAECEGRQGLDRVHQRRAPGTQPLDRNVIRCSRWRDAHLQRRLEDAQRDPESGHLQVLLLGSRSPPGGDGRHADRPIERAPGHSAICRGRRILGAGRMTASRAGAPRALSSCAPRRRHGGKPDRRRAKRGRRSRRPRAERR